MEKTLVYHLYIMDNCRENFIYDIHRFCLGRYIDRFDKIKIVICVDDLKRQDLISFGYEWILSLNISCPLQINVLQNDELGESRTFLREIVNEGSDGMVYFAHSKGVTRIIDGQISESVLLWLLCLYFYSFEYMDAVEESFIGMPLRQSVFYGPLLLIPREFVDIEAFGPHFAGVFYWVNMPKYKNLKREKRIIEVEPIGRWFAEIYPGTVFDYRYMGCGLKTIKDAFFEMEDVQTYKMNRYDWNNIFQYYGKVDEMNNFIEEMYNFIGYERIDFTNKTVWDD